MWSFTFTQKQKSLKFTVFFQQKENAIDATLSVLYFIIDVVACVKVSQTNTARCWPTSISLPCQTSAPTDVNIWVCAKLPNKDTIRQKKPLTPLCARTKSVMLSPTLLTAPVHAEPSSAYSPHASDIHVLSQSASVATAIDTFPHS